MSDDTRPLWQIWRDAEDAALEGIEIDDPQEVDALCDAARIEAIRSWLFPGGIPQYDRGVWQRLTVEIERCQGRLDPANDEGEAEASLQVTTPN